ncbi:hypothetical protein C2134_06595 [Chromobacterium sinusclupearum]|uniref:Uncharacterized protein n=1 Tax=Chromobacterium sinusclupearum TaxID=2077146 RepID=A0A2K4MR05_9NEIS|nr:hypothetical protein C2134_06595 [Chromobacterium sinusclupearum]
MPRIVGAWMWTLDEKTFSRKLPLALRNCLWKELDYRFDTAWRIARPSFSIPSLLSSEDALCCMSQYDIFVVWIDCPVGKCLESL